MRWDSLTCVMTFAALSFAPIATGRSYNPPPGAPRFQITVTDVRANHPASCSPWMYCDPKRMNINYSKRIEASPGQSAHIEIGQYPLGLKIWDHGGEVNYGGLAFDRFLFYSVSTSSPLLRLCKPSHCDETNLGQLRAPVQFQVSISSSKDFYKNHRSAETFDWSMTILVSQTDLYTGQFNNINQYGVSGKIYYSPPSSAWLSFLETIQKEEGIGSGDDFSGVMSIEECRNLKEDGIRSQDLLSQLHSGGASKRDRCLNHFGVRTSNPEACLAINIPKYRTDCLSSVAVKLDSPELCEKLPSDTFQGKVECSSRFGDQPKVQEVKMRAVALAQTNYTLALSECQKLKSRFDSERCHTMAAESYFMGRMDGWYETDIAKAARICSGPVSLDQWDACIRGGCRGLVANPSLKNAGSSAAMVNAFRKILRDQEQYRESFCHFMNSADRSSVCETFAIQQSLAKEFCSPSVMRKLKNLFR